MLYGPGRILRAPRVGGNGRAKKTRMRKMTRMPMTTGLMLAAFLGAGHSAAHADGHAVAAKAGALGLGIEYTYSFSDRLGVRVGVNGSELGFDAEESGIEYDFDLV